MGHVEELKQGLNLEREAARQQAEQVRVLQATLEHNKGTIEKLSLEGDNQVDRYSTDYSISRFIYFFFFPSGVL